MHYQELFKQFMDRFKAALKLVVSPDQLMAHMAFVKGLMHDLIICNHRILENLVISRIERYQDAQPIIFCFLNLETLWDSRHEKAQGRQQLLVRDQEGMA